MNSSGKLSRTHRNRRGSGHTGSVTILGYDQGIPIVPVTVRRVVPVITRRFMSVVELYLAACPYCGKPHIHGGGTPDEDPHKYEGHRGSHCLKKVTGDRGYILRIVDEETL